MTLTLQKRVEEYKSECMYVYDAAKKLMMCKCCNCRVDWVRKSTVDNHCASAGHIAAKKKFFNSDNAPKRQVSLEENISNAKKAKTEKEEFIMSTARAFLAANIPINRLEDANLRAWMNKYVKGANDFPKERTLRDVILPRLKEEEEDTLRQLVADKHVLIECDESTDRRGRAIFIVLLRIFSKNSAAPPKLVVAGVCELPAANSKECSRCIIDVFNKCDIKYDNVKGMVSDSAAYMTACFNTLKGIIGDHLIHIQCWAHKLDKVNMIPSQYFHRLNEFVSKSKKIFKNSHKRRNRYQSFLQNKYKDELGNVDAKRVKCFPLPVMTRWNSWKKSSDYVCEYADDIVEFVKSLDDDDVKAIRYFKCLSVEDVSIINVTCFVKEHCSSVSELLLLVEGCNYPLAHKLYPKVDELLAEYSLPKDSSNILSMLGEETKANLEALLSKTKKQNLLDRFKTVAKKNYERLESLKRCDPANTFFNAVATLFNPVQMLSSSDGSIRNAMTVLPSLVDAFPLPKLLLAYRILKGHVEAALNHGGRNLLSSSNTASTNKTDVVVECLAGMLGADHSQFAGVCLNLVYYSVSNTDSERSFSGYGDIVSPKRTSFKVENAETMMYLYCNDKEDD